MVGAKNLQVAKLVPQTKFVIGLELVTMAGSADTLKIFPAIWIASIESSDEPRRHNVVYMSAYSNPLEISCPGRRLAPPA